MTFPLFFRIRCGFSMCNVAVVCMALTVQEYRSNTPDSSVLFACLASGVSGY